MKERNDRDIRCDNRLTGMRNIGNNTLKDTQALTGQTNIFFDSIKE